MNRNPWTKLGDFVLGKGFYIVLFLCLAAIGISGYYMVRFAGGSQDPAQSVTGTPKVTLPDPVEQPQGEKPQEQQTQKEDPQPVKEPVEEETAAPETTGDETVVYTWPVKGEVLRGFSVETLAYDQTMGDWRTHSGVDIAAEEGLKVLAPGKGEVTQVYDDPMMGSTVVISHPDGRSSLCANLAEVQVAVGDQVDTGAVIGVVGGGAMAESAMPSHLHLEMTAEDGGPVDPLTVLPALS